MFSKTYTWYIVCATLGWLGLNISLILDIIFRWVQFTIESNVYVSMCSDSNFETSIKYLLYIVYYAEHKDFKDKNKPFSVRLENRYVNKKLKYNVKYS